MPRLNPLPQAAPTGRFHRSGLKPLPQAAPTGRSHKLPLPDQRTVGFGASP